MLSKGEKESCCVRPSYLDVDMALRCELRGEMLKRVSRVASKKEESGHVSVGVRNVCTRRSFIFVSPSGIHHSLQLVELPRTP
jgi:hypothetical protein